MSEANSTRAAGSCQRTQEQKRKAAEYARKWRRANPEKSKAAWKRWYQRHKEARLQYCRRYAKIHPEVQRKSHAKYKSKRNAYSRKWGQLNKARRREYMLDYCKRNQARRRKTYREWVLSNPRKVQARAKRWRERNPAKIAATNAATKARRRGAETGDNDVGQLIAKWKSEKSFPCYWCGDRFPRKELHIDHIIPVNKGGTHTCNNVCRACSTCNLRKKDRIVNDPDFIGQRQLALT